jgi:hypothetical protein
MTSLTGDDLISSLTDRIACLRLKCKHLEIHCGGSLAGVFGAELKWESHVNGQWDRELRND